jgi:signal transduction histidine kinase
MVDGAPSEFLLSASASATGEAKEAFGRILDGEATALLDRIMVLITELLLSAGSIGAQADAGRMAIRIIQANSSVRIEIRDEGTGMVLGGLRKMHGPASHGWSPHLLSRIADRWGLVSGAEGAWVWFELDVARAE